MNHLKMFEDYSHDSLDKENKTDNDLEINKAVEYLKAGKIADAIEVMIPIKKLIAKMGPYSTPALVNLASELDNLEKSNPKMAEYCKIIFGCSGDLKCIIDKIKLIPKTISLEDEALIGSYKNGEISIIELIEHLKIEREHKPLQVGGNNERFKEKIMASPAVRFVIKNLARKVKSDMQAFKNIEPLFKEAVAKELGFTKQELDDMEDWGLF